MDGPSDFFYVIRINRHEEVEDLSRNELRKNSRATPRDLFHSTGDVMRR